MVPFAQRRRATFADDHVGVRQSRLRGRVGQDRLAVIQIHRERCRNVRVGAGDVGAKVGKQPPADRSGETLAELNDAKTG